MWDGRPEWQVGGRPFAGAWRLRKVDENELARADRSFGSLDFETDFKDEAYQSGAIYYVRVTQEKRVRGLTAMAWSSPIWTSSAPE